MRNLNKLPEIVYNTVYALRAGPCPSNIAPFGRNIVYTRNLKKYFWINYISLKFKTTYVFQNKIII